MTTTFPAVKTRSWVLLYTALVVLPALAIPAALHYGARLPTVGSASLPAAAAPMPTPVAPAAAPGESVHIGLLLGQLLVIFLVTRSCGLLVRPLGQPQVVGEMLAGLLLGPSLFGLVAPAAAAALFPASSLGVLSALSQVGMVFFMFLVGLELDTAALRRQGRSALLASHLSIVLPFALGTLLAIGLYPVLAPPGVPFMPFALFIGAAMSVTAFPVLARILSEREWTKTPLGALALSTAAVDDVSAWTLLAAIVILVRTGEARTPVLPLLGLALFVGAVYVLRGFVRQRLADAFRRHGRVTHDQVAALVALVLVGACITEALGVHALFGAFVIGLALAAERPVAEAVRERLEDLLVLVLLPLYFAFTGLRTRLDLVTDPALLGWAALILAVAMAGKLGGTVLAARVTGIPGRDALALGILMNTRGLMELVILNVGLDLGVLSPSLYSMMVLMALATTVMTQPLLSLVAPARSPRPS